MYFNVSSLVTSVGQIKTSAVSDQQQKKFFCVLQVTVSGQPTIQKLYKAKQIDFCRRRRFLHA